LAKRVGLNLIDVVKAPIHGNSYIFILSRKNYNPRRVQNIIALETAYGLLDPETYVQWANNVHNNMDKLINKINQHREMGYVLVGYGAAAKGNTLLNYGDIHLDFIIDDNPLKQDKFTPGTGCAIVGIEHLNQFTPEDQLLFVPLAWNFFREIKSKIQTARNNNKDRFLKYFPQVEVHQ
jgi:hypothetical protein